jgi:hypothetical protein
VNASVQALSSTVRVYPLPNGLTVGGTSNEEGSVTSSSELLATLSRANELQSALDASIRREAALEQRVRDLQQQLNSRDFIEQLRR